MAGAELLLQIVLCTLAMELATVFCRFILGWQSTRDTAATIGRLTGGIRIHHGYFGVGLLAAAPLYWSTLAIASWVVVGGAALVLSDLIHHFLVLWPITGRHEFDLVYPRTEGSFVDDQRSLDLLADGAGRLAESVDGGR